METTYTLPDLPYAYDAFEPWCSAETMQIHHDKHHAGYVKKANAAASELAEVDLSDTAKVAGLRAALGFNLSGHVMHSLFWTSLSPRETAPEGDLSARIQRDFGSRERLVTALKGACVGVEGSGWGTLSVDPMSGRLMVLGIEDHHNKLVPDAMQIAAIDVWEHAYYLTFRNERAKWVDAAIDHLDWLAISDRFEASMATLV